MLFLLTVATVVSVQAQVAPSPTQCRTAGATCMSCTTVSICVKPNSTAVTVDCERPTPYCNAGSCSAVPGTKECTSLLKFGCPQEDGVYPDGNNCRMYHICLNGSSHNFSCSVPRSVYSAQTESCVRQTQQNSCNLVRCWKENGFVPYPSEPSLYFLCVNSKPTIVQRCPKGLKFDLNSQSCTMSCPREGKFPDPFGNSSTFVECTATSPAGFAAISRACPVQSKFNPVSMRCSLDTTFSAQRPSRVTAARITAIPDFYQANSLENSSS